MATSASVMSGMPFSIESLRMRRGIRAFVVVLVAGQHVDDEIETIGLEVGKDVGRAAVGDLVDLGALDAVLDEEAVRAGGGVKLDVERQDAPDGRQHALLVLDTSGADQKILAALAPEELQVKRQKLE